MHLRSRNLASSPSTTTPRRSPVRRAATGATSATRGVDETGSVLLDASSRTEAGVRDTSGINESGGVLDASGAKPGGGGGKCLRRVQCVCFVAALLSIALVVLLPLFASRIAPIVDPDATYLHQFASDAGIEIRRRPGEVLAQELNSNHSIKHPVLIIPGIVSTGLELWQGKPCVRHRFRERIWGESLMVEKLLVNPACWIEHIMMNSSSGLDPDGVRVRPASGIRAADVVMGAFSLWGPLIESLSDLGYDERNVDIAAYDWRLSMSALEERDRYFSRLLASIELFGAINAEPRVVVVTHSFGSNVFTYFMQWARQPRPLGGGKNDAWFDAHVASWINIAGPLLGVPKSLATLLSGEMRDTAEMPPLMQLLMNKFIRPRERMKLFRSFRSVAAMLPMGGDAIWGRTGSDAAHLAPPDAAVLQGGVSSMLTLHGGVARALDGENSRFAEWFPMNCTGAQQVPAPVCARRLGIEGALDFLRVTAPRFMGRMDAVLNTTARWPPAQALSVEAQQRYWQNPLASVLPLAKRMSIYCVYGANKLTERAYNYKMGSLNSSGFSGWWGGGDDADNADWHPVIDQSIHAPTDGVFAGVHMANGDGTVPLLSLGYMCVKGWKEPSRNPASIPVTTREYLQSPGAPTLLGRLPADVLGAVASAGLRGALDALRGNVAADHVDILLNEGMIGDVLRVCTGSALPQQVLSGIEQMAERVEL